MSAVVALCILLGMHDGSGLSRIHTPTIENSFKTTKSYGSQDLESNTDAKETATNSDSQMLSCLREVLWNDLPILEQPADRTALNGKGQEIHPLGATFAHHGDAGSWRRWNKSIMMARGAEIPPLKQQPCYVWEVGAHRKADASREHMQRYPSCEYHAYEPIPEFAAELRTNWASEPKMHIHEYGLGAEDATLQVPVEALQEIATFIGDSNGNANGESSKTISAQIKNFDFALKEVGEGIFPTLLDVNCEGCEYDFLLQAQQHGFLKHVKVILISWHAYGQEGLGAKAWQLCEVRVALSKTHKMAYGFGFGWERWVLKD